LYSEYKKCSYCDNDFFNETLTDFCSTKCKTYHKAPHYKIIDDNIEQIIILFKKCNSITKVLKEFDIIGRKGNSYLSNILKENGIEVLTRRNSKMLG